MSNDASLDGIPADGGARDGDSDGDDWESTALKRVAARRRELHDACQGESKARRATDWEQHAVECLKRYFRAQR